MDKLICVGKNYLKHALELGDPVPKEAVYFIKPPSTLAVVSERAKITWPGPRRGDLHHEIELVFRLRSDGGRLRVSEYTLGLDMTLRSVQAGLKKAGLPWEKGKTFTNAAIVGPFQPVTDLHTILATPFELTVNGEVRQRGIASDMHWKLDVLLEDLPRWFPVRDGDLLFTGTPEGVGPIEHGDELMVAGGPIRYVIQAERSEA